MMDGDGVIPSGGIADAPVVNASTSLQSDMINRRIPPTECRNCASRSLRWIADCSLLQSTWE